jgi:hypothetical protein
VVRADAYSLCFCWTSKKICSRLTNNLSITSHLFKLVHRIHTKLSMQLLYMSSILQYSTHSHQKLFCSLNHFLRKLHNYTLAFNSAILL